MIHSLSGQIINWAGWTLRGLGFSAEAKIIFAAMPTAPNYQRKLLIDNLVKGLIDDGIWAKLDCLYLTAAHEANSSLLNWINPGTHDLTVVNLLAAQFTVDRGWTGNGVNGYLRTNYIPSIDGINLTLNSTSIGAYCRLNIIENTTAIGARDDTPISNYLSLLPSIVGGDLYISNNDGTWGIVANADSRGFYINSRIAANVRNCYRNKANIISDVQASVRIMDKELFVLARNDNGTGVTYFSTNQIAAAFIGGGMTQTNANNFTDRLELFLDSIGAGIIP